MGLLRDKLLLLGLGRGWLGAGDGDMGTSAASFLYSFTGLRKNIYRAGCVNHPLISRNLAHFML